MVGRAAADAVVAELVVEVVVLMRKRAWVAAWVYEDPLSMADACQRAVACTCLPAVHARCKRYFQEV